MIKKLLFSILLVNALNALAQPANLYMVGNATPIGWQIGNAIPMNQTSTGIFEYIGPLFPGDFKLPVSQNTCFCQDFYTKDSGNEALMVYNVGGSGTDLKWTITTLAQYQVIANTNNLSISITQLSPIPIFTRFWMIGDATSAGWSMDAAINLSFNQSTTNPNEFVYEGSLTPGEFKIFAGSFNDFCGVFYNPMISNQPFSNIAAQQVNNCSADLKWNVSTSGVHRVTLNTTNSTVTILDPAALSNSEFNSFKYKIYPNPAKDVITINSSIATNDATISIFNELGQQVLISKQNFNDNTVSVDVSSLHNGNYIISITGDQNSNNFKIIINK